MVRGRHSAVCALALLTLLLTLASAAFNAAPPLSKPASVESPSVAGGNSGAVVGPVTPTSFEGNVRDLPPVNPAVGFLPDEGANPPGYQEPPVSPSGDQARGSEISGTDGANPAGDAAERDAVTPPQFANANPNFEGLSCGGCPPDPTGDVGPNHYVEMVNSAFAVWNKQGTQLAGPANINSLWNDNNPATNSLCERSNLGDPIVVYDQLADRWLLSQFAADLDASNNPIAPFGLCVAISQTPDPTSTYHLYEFPTTNFPDYPKFAVWPDGYYVTTHEGEHAIYVLDRANMLNGNPAVMIRQSIANVGGGRGARILPSDWDGATAPPPGSPNYLVRSIDGAVNGGNDRLEVYEATTNWQLNPPTLTISAPLTLTPAAFDTQFSDCFTTRACVPQPNTTQEIDNLSNRLMWRLQYRNFGTYEAMVVNQTVDFNATDRSAVRWYEFRKSGGGAWAIHQQGTYSPDTVNRFMGSIAMDSAGNIALGYTATLDAATNANDVFNSVRYTGRLATDPLGLLPASESTLVAGTLSQTGSARWGDYTQMAVDPVDDCTFWYVGEYNAGQSRIGAFRFPSCNPVDLRITKSDSPDPVNAGQQLTYTIDVSNVGTTAANNVVVTDVLPAGVTFLSSAPGCTSVGGTLTCPVGALLPTQTVSLVIQVGVPSGFLGASPTATIINRATVTAEGQTEANTANNTATAITTVRALADLAVTKICKPDSPQAQRAGADAFCDIYVDNFGPSDATGVTLTDVLTSIAPFRLLGVTVTPTASGVCAPTSSSAVTSVAITCDLGIEPAGGRTAVRVTFTGDEAGQVNDLARVASATPDPNPANNQAQGRVDFTASADLWLDKTVAKNKDGAVFTLAVHNDTGCEVDEPLSCHIGGPSAATEIVVTDRLPLDSKRLVVVSVSPGCTYTKATHTVVCRHPSLVAGAHVSFTITVKLKDDNGDGGHDAHRSSKTKRKGADEEKTTEVTNTATVTSVVFDPRLSNNSDSVIAIFRIEKH